METRKIMRLGRSSLVISLPKHWVELNRLKSGDVVSVAPQRDGSLAIFPGLVKRGEKNEVTIKVGADDTGNAIVRKIVACYLNGYSDIFLVSSGVFTASQQRAIRNIAGKLYLQVMDASSRSMHIQSLLDEFKVSVEGSLRRMHVITSAMFQDVLKALETWDMKLARAVYTLDDNVDQFFFMLLRLLRMAMTDISLANQMGLKLLDCMDYEAVVRKIEHIADHVANIAGRILVVDGSKERFSPALVEAMLAVGWEAHNAYNSAINALLTGDIQVANQIVDSYAEISKLCDRVAERMRAEKSNVVVCATCSIRDSIMSIAGFTCGIAEIAIDRAMESRK